MQVSALPRSWQIGALAFLWIGTGWLGSFIGMRTTTLVFPIDVQFDYLMISAGLCGAALIVFLARSTILDEERLDRVLSGSLSDQMIVLIALIGPIAAGGLSGHYLARMTVEWRAFFNFRPVVSEQTFKVAGHTINRKGPDWINLRSAADNFGFSIGCGNLDCSKIHIGDQLRLKVETGRAGVQRVTLRAHSDQLGR